MHAPEIEIANTLLSFQKWAHVKLLWETDKSVELLLVPRLSGPDKATQFSELLFSD